MNGPRDCHNDWCKSGREWEISYDIWYKWTCLPKRNRCTDFDYEILVTRGKRWGEGIIREFQINMNTLLYLKWITNKALLYSTESSAQCYVADWMGGEFGGEWIHVYVWLSHSCVHLEPSRADSLHSCLTLGNPVDCRLPGSSVHGILQARNNGVGCHALLQVVFPTQGSNSHLFLSPALAGEFFTTGSTWEALKPPQYCSFAILQYKIKS